MIKCNYYVYLLKSTTTRRVYVGYTIDVKKRLLKHNGKLAGGAKKTRKGRPWEIVLYVTGFEYEKTALQFECRIHHPPKGFRRGGVRNTMKIMKFLLESEKICSTAPLNCDLNLSTFFMSEKYYDMWKMI